MAYSYDAGSATPVAAGMAEFGGLRVNNGTFITNKIEGVLDTPPARITETPIGGEHGAYASPVLWGARRPIIDATARAGSRTDLDGAIQAMKDAWVAAPTGQLVAFRFPGWAQRRHCRCQLVPEGLVWANPDQGFTKRPWRDFLLSLVAPDPRLYNADAQYTIDVPLGAGYTSAPNIGNFEAPMWADFYGPFTTLSLIDDANSRSMQIGVAVPDGEFIRVRTLEKTAIRSGNNVNWYGNLNGTLWGINPGGLALRIAATGTTGAATKVRLTYRDTWI